MGMHEKVNNGCVRGWEPCVFSFCDLPYISRIFSSDQEQPPGLFTRLFLNSNLTAFCFLPPISLFLQGHPPKGWALPNDYRPHPDKNPRG